MLKKIVIAVAAVMTVVGAIVLVPVLAGAETPSVRRTVAGCETLPPEQQRACRDCINRGSHYYVPSTGQCHPNRRPPRRNH